MMDKLAAVNSQLNPNSEESMRDEAVMQSLLGSALEDLKEDVKKFQDDFTNNTNMSATDDVDDEYLDDPISLLRIEDIKTEICNDEEHIIAVSSDEEEERCTSAYGKKNFVLPVTFFDISRNVRLLNRCKPLSIRIVDCKQHPTHYIRYKNKFRNKSDESSLEADGKGKSDIETNPSNDSVVDFAGITSKKEKADNVPEREKKRRIYSYEKLQKRKEKRKQIALNSKNLSQLDFKRNIGLVGLKITDTIFKQIVDSENEIHITKFNLKESKLHEKSPRTLSNTEKTPILDGTFNENCNSVIDKALTIRKIPSIEKDLKENNKTYLGEPENTLLLMSKTTTSNGNVQEKNGKVTEGLSIKKITSTGNEYGKKESEKVEIYIENGSDHTDQEKSKKKSDSTTQEHVSVVDFAGITSKKEKADNVPEREKKRRIYSYEKLKKRKEKRKQIALNSKNLSQLDFKRNIGLVGLKITDTIFKQIVDSENEIHIAKFNLKESKLHEKSPKTLSNTEKTPILDGTFNENCNSVIDKALTIRKIPSIEKDLKENKKTYLGEPENTLLLMSKTTTSNGNVQETNGKVTEGLSIKKITSTGNEYGKKESEKVKIYIENGSDHTDQEKSNKKSDSTTQKHFIKAKIKSLKLKRKEKRPTDVQSAKLGSDCNCVSATEAIKEKLKKQKCKRKKYMKKVGAVSDSLGTSVVPLTSNHTEPKNVSLQDNFEVNSIKAKMGEGEVKDKLYSNKDGNQVRCSLAILNNNVVDKVLKLKKAKTGPKKSASIVFQPHIKKLDSKVGSVATSINLKQSKHTIDSICLTSERDTIEIRPTNINEIEKHFDGTKEAEKTVVKDASRDQAGPNSPVIPCTTITVRAATPKLNSKLPMPKVTSINEQQDSATLFDTQPSKTWKSSSPINTAETKCTSVQNQPNLPNVFNTKKKQSSNSKFAATSIHNETVLKNSNIPADYDAKGTLTCNQNTISNRKPVKVKELAALSSQHSVPTIAERPLCDNNQSNVELTKEFDLANKPNKQATAAGSLTINGLVSHQADTNQYTTMPPSSRMPSKFSGHNAIILRKSLITTPRQQLLNFPPSNQGQAIQTKISGKIQYQPIQPGLKPMQFHYPLPFPPLPPPPPTPINNNPNLIQIRPQRFIAPNTPPTYLRGMETALHHWRFYNPPFPVNRPPSSAPRLPRPQFNNGSFIGNTANGDPIKKINIPLVPSTVNDKQKMLAELNDAVLPSELTNNQDDEPSNPLKRKADNIPVDLTSKHSKPGPLSKKNNITFDKSEVKIPDKLSPNFGYSPPILPILSYQESLLKIFSSTVSQKTGTNTPNNVEQNCTLLKRTTSTGSIRKLDKNHKRLPRQQCKKQDKAKKISFDDYRKRVIYDVDNIDVYKMRKFNEAKNAADAYNQDQGYDSDSPVKL